MSAVSFSFVFAGNITHKIVSFCVSPFCICTGASTGEIAIWKKNHKFEVGVICAITDESACIRICSMEASHQIKHLLGTDYLIVSLYSNAKLRTWDTNDGKCVAYSYDLFNEEENKLMFLEKISEGRVVVGGETEIFVVDALEMKKIRYFAVHDKILEVLTAKNEILVSDLNQIRVFDVEDEDDQGKVLKKFINQDQKPKVGYDGQVLLVAKANELEIIIDPMEKQTKHHALKFVAKISYLEVSQGKVLVMLRNQILCYQVTDLLNSQKPIQHTLQFTPRFSRIFNDQVFYTDQTNVFSFDLRTHKHEAFKFFFPDPDFSILNHDEHITSRNILISSEILYAIGTSQGRTIVSTIIPRSKIVFFDKKTEVTGIFLEKSTLVIAYLNETLSFWDFKLSPGTFYHSVPSKTIEVWTSHVKVLIPIDYSKRNIDFFNEMSWKNSKVSWTDIVLGQCHNGSISLICLKSQEILCYFQALKSTIIKATMYLSLEYLAIMCANGNIYIFNMIMQALEREISGDAIANFDNVEITNEALLKTLKNSPKFISCLEFYFVEASKKAIEVRIVCMGMHFFPCLYLNITKLVKTKHRYSKAFLENVCDIVQSNLFKLGTFGIHKAISIKCDWVASKFSNSLKIAALISLGCESPKIVPDTVSLIIFALNPLSNIRTKLFEYIDLSSDVVDTAEKLLIVSNKSSRKKGRSMTLSSSSNFSCEKYHSQRTFLSLFEAIAISIITCASIAIGENKGSNVIELLIKMIKSGENGYILMACEMIFRSESLFKSYLKDSQLEDITKELLLYSCKDFKHITKEYFYKVITCLSMRNLQKFIKILSTEIKNNDLDPFYQHNIIFMIEYFILNNYLESTTVLDDLGDFILVAHDLKNRLNNKDFSNDFTSVLSVFVSFLPMTKVTQDHRYFIVGLPTGWINLYDFKTDKKWKSIKVFETTISALDVRENYVACYSSQQSCLSVIKIDVGIFGSILGQGDLKFVERVRMQEIEPVPGTYQDMIKIVRVKWGGYRSVLVTRENKVEYCVNLGKI